MSVNKLEKLSCIVSIVDISKWLDFDNQEFEQTNFLEYDLIDHIFQNVADVFFSL